MITSQQMVFEERVRCAKLCDIAAACADREASEAVQRAKRGAWWKPRRYKLAGYVCASAALEKAELARTLARFIRSGYDPKQELDPNDTSPNYIVSPPRSDFSWGCGGSGDGQRR